MRRFSTICNCVNVQNVEKLQRATLSCHNSLTIYAMRKTSIAFDSLEKILSLDVFTTLLYTLCKMKKIKLHKCTSLWFNSVHVVQFNY